MKIVLAGEPIAQKRHRHAGKRTYDPSSADKKRVQRMVLVQRVGPRKDSRYKEPIRVDFYFFCGMPEKSWSDKKKREMEGVVRAKKPDIDNYIKFYLDCMNGIIFTDDNLVAEIYAKKVYSQKPCTVITIKPYEDE